MKSISLTKKNFRNLKVIVIDQSFCLLLPYHQLTTVNGISILLIWANDTCCNNRHTLPHRGPISGRILELNKFTLSSGFVYKWIRLGNSQRNKYPRSNLLEIRFSLNHFEMKTPHLDLTFSFRIQTVPYELAPNSDYFQPPMIQYPRVGTIV